MIKKNELKKQKKRMIKRCEREESKIVCEILKHWVCGESWAYEQTLCWVAPFRAQNTEATVCDEGRELAGATRARARASARCVSERLCKCSCHINEGHAQKNALALNAYAHSL